jgi:hypothetical protein
VTATPTGAVPTAMSVGFLVRVFTSIVDTESLAALATKAVLPSGVTATSSGAVPTAMSVGFFVLVFTSMVDTVPLALAAWPTVAEPELREGDRGNRAGACDGDYQRRAAVTSRAGVPGYPSGSRKVPCVVE